MQDDLENVNFLALSELEKMEFNLQLLSNYNKIMLQLMAGQNFAMAAVMSFSLLTQTINPNKLLALVAYAKTLYETTLQEAQLQATSAAQCEKMKQENQTESPATKETKQKTDENNIIHIDGKEN